MSCEHHLSCKLGSYCVDWIVFVRPNIYIANFVVINVHVFKGQTFDNAEVCFWEPKFPHAQIYAALMRSISENYFKIFINDIEARGNVFKDNKIFTNVRYIVKIYNYK